MLPFPLTDFIKETKECMEACIGGANVRNNKGRSIEMKRQKLRRGKPAGFKALGGIYH